MESQLQNVPKLNLSGTYYVSSGTYVSPSGVGYSTKDIPIGTKVEFKKDPYLEKGRIEVPQSTKKYWKEKGYSEIEAEKIAKFSRERRMTPTIDKIREITRKKIDIKLPDIKKETYDPRSKMYISTSPTGERGTAYMRPPTPEERIKIEKAQERGDYYVSLGGGGFIEEKIVSPTLEYIRPVTKTIRDIPVVGGYTSPKITFGEALLETKEGLQKVTEYSASGWGSTGELFFKTAEGKPRITKNILESGGYLFQGVGVVTKQIPTIIQYSTPAGVIGGTTVDVLATEEKLEKPEKYVKEVLDKQYKIYEKQYKKQLEELQEGYELEPKLSKTEFEKKYSKEVKSNIEKQIRGEAVLPFIILGTAGIGKGYKFLKTPRVVEGSIKGGEILKLEGLQKRFPILTDEGIKEYAKFKDMFIRTPTTAYKQSFFGKIIGKEPELVVLSRGQTYVGQPVANILKQPVEVGKPYIYRLGRVGKKGDIVNAKFFQVSGKSEDILKESLINLPKKEQYIWKTLIEKTKTGVPIRYEDLSKYFSEKELLQMGITRQLDISKLGTGRATKLIETGSIVKPIKQFELGAGTFRVETGIKDITKPLARPTGRIDISKDIIIRYPLLSKETGTGVDVFLGGGKKSSKQFLKQLYKLETPKPIIKPTPTIPKPTSTTKTITEPTKDLIPTYLGGTAISSQDIYAGTGQYEILEVSRLTPKISPSIISEPRIDLKTEQISFTIPKTDIKERTFLETPQKTKSFLDLTQKPLTLLGEKQILKERLTQKEVQALKTRQLLKQVAVTPQITTTITKIESKPPKPPKPPKPSIKIPFKFGKPEKKKKKKIGLDEDEFEVFVKKRGKDISIGEFGTLEQAKTKLFKELKSTLRASGFIQRGEEKIKVSDWISGEFRKAKREPFRIVQKRERRIKTGGEIGEILTARKRKGGFFK